jgi:hypothetical protein
MNWDAISAISETISSLAVIISLIYLAQQIRHSNKLSHSQTRTDLRHQGNAETETLIEHPDIWLMMWKEKLTAEEQSRIHFFWSGRCVFVNTSGDSTKWGFWTKKLLKHISAL